MTVTVYNSTDASAPVLTGLVGSLIGVLDACLVNGYGAKAAAGWTKPFANSGNIGCWKNSAVNGTGMCLSMDDNGTGAGGGQEALTVGYATLTAVATGTIPFPSTTVFTLGSNTVRKSATASSTARAWTLIADDTVFYFFPYTGDWTSPTGALPFSFGDIFSYKTADTGRCLHIGRNTQNSASLQYEFFGLSSGTGTTLSARLPGHFMPYTYTGIGSCIQVGKHIDLTKMGGAGQPDTPPANTAGGVQNGPGFNVYPSNFAYPNGPDGGLYLSPVWVHHNGVLRGYMKGLWAPLHNMPLNDGDTFSGSGNMAGKSFVMKTFWVYSSVGGSPGQYAVETSSTWA